jgi:proteic killer suppression protein
MEICFKDKKLQKLCEHHIKLQAKYGKLKAHRILLRIGDLQDALNLQDVQMLPQARLHPLQGNRKGQFALDTEHPYRLIIVPQNGINNDLCSITKIEIISINEDYH